MDYRTRLKDLREDHDLTQKELAELLHIHQTTYSAYELGEVNVPLPTLCFLAEFYKTSIDYLAGITDEITPYPKAK